jgi:adenine phosphoribosyltransferase
LIATGGSAKAAQELILKCGGTVLEFIFFIELTFLKGYLNLNAPVYSLMKFDD